MAARNTSSSSLTDLIRKDNSVTVPGVSRSDRRPFAISLSISSGAEWQDVVNQVTTLFQTKKMSIKLHELTEKVKNVKAELGAQINDFYQESILKKGMIILREEVREKSSDFLNKLSDCWTVFFCNILPTLQAVFVSLPQSNGLSVREVSLVYFRDIIVLKTKLDKVIDQGIEVPPRIVQMLLVLQSVHDKNLENYQKLEKLVAKTVNPYLCTSILSLPKPKLSVVDSDAVEQHQTKIFTIGNERLDPVMEVEVGSQRSSVSSVSNESTVPNATPVYKPSVLESDYSASHPLS
ncbi:proline-rich protein 5-like [Xenia sp. Carnegie-2017]|uniref:proline-rich protein 5-like n=1 Tax=Xenia sp. Carnegie-2017 TaxID=2897299 RepID=UPI001F03DD60|nr:proline-rich protein 5-like [Xenia sp. Carnegie-2017]